MQPRRKPINVSKEERAASKKFAHTIDRRKPIRAKSSHIAIYSKSRTPNLMVTFLNWYLTQLTQTT